MIAKFESLIRQRLDDTGVRYTGGRRAVVEVLLAAEGPLSASEAHDAMTRRVPLSSLYRTLAVLEESGVVAPHHGARGVTRYELAEWLQGHHHHLVCLVCGTVEDVELSPVDEQQLVQLVAKATDRESFLATGHSLEVEGRCSRCA